MVIQVYVNESKMKNLVKHSLYSSEQLDTTHLISLESQVIGLFPQLVQAYINDNLDELIQKSANAVIEQYLYNKSCA